MSAETLSLSVAGYRPELTTMPDRIRALPVYRGYPVPWFVAWVPKPQSHPDIKHGPPGMVPEFRCADGAKWMKAVQSGACWVCGTRLGVNLTFVLGPMCGINRVTAEPPCHRECAEWSAINCPFLSRPDMVRRENNLPAESADPPGTIKRNPGVTLIWTTKSYTLINASGHPLIEVGEPHAISWYHRGRAATRQEVIDAVRGGLPTLLASATEPPATEPTPEVAAEINQAVEWLSTQYPKD